MATRRGFLSMLGGAFAAPLMPSVSFAAASKAAYPASALHAAIYHAHGQVSFSAFSLGKHLGLDLGQTNALMQDMSTRGILGPLQGATKSGQWARSNIWKRPFVEAVTAQKAAKVKRAKTVTQEDAKKVWSEPDIRPLLANLQKMAVNHGFTLNPRCAALVA